MSDTHLDQRIRDDLRRLVAASPLAPAVEDITTPTVELRPITAPPRRRLVLALASVVVLLGLVAGAGALLLGGDGAPPAVSAQTDPDLTVYLNPDATDAQIEGVRATLLASPLVQELAYVDQEQAFLEFEMEFVDDRTLIGNVTPDSLPPSFRVVLVDRDVASAGSLLVELETSPGVRELVFAPGPSLFPQAWDPDTPTPRMVLDDPSWTALRSPESDLTVDASDVEALTVYRGEQDLLPFVSVAVVRGDDDDPVMGEPTVVRGRPARLGPVQGDGFSLHWQEEGGRSFAMVGIGPSSDELIALADGLVEGADGSFALAQPPDGMVEAFQSGDLPTQATRYEPTVTFDRQDADVTIDVVHAGGYAFWSSVTDELYGSVPVDPSIEVSTALLDFPTSETVLVSLWSDEHHVYWTDRHGTVAVELTLHGPRELLDGVLASIREVDQDTYDAIPMLENASG